MGRRGREERRGRERSSEGQREGEGQGERKGKGEREVIFFAECKNPPGNAIASRTYIPFDFISKKQHGRKTKLAETNRNENRNDMYGVAIICYLLTNSTPLF